ncbi:MAG: DUF2442 domain-containing protein [Planctomycetes bacterium]|nr:DUF2442 domain-containing protein [Planctomycetota bacterium]
MPPRIAECRAIGNYQLWLRFSTGQTGEVDLSHLAGRGVFASWLQSGVFESVRIDPISGTVSWPGGIDLDPDVLLHKIIGTPLPGTHPGTSSTSAA